MPERAFRTELPTDADGVVFDRRARILRWGNARTCRQYGTCDNPAVMLAIRPSQVAALERARLDAFVRQALPDLRRTWPSRCAGLEDGALLADLREAAHLAFDCGVTGEQSLGTFLNLRIMLGFRFPTASPYAWAMDILRDPSAGGREKIARIQARLADRD